MSDVKNTIRFLTIKNHKEVNSVFII